MSLPRPVFPTKASVNNNSVLAKEREREGQSTPLTQDRTDVDWYRATL
jgi:hypothetical protein